MDPIFFTRPFQHFAIFFFTPCRTSAFFKKYVIDHEGRFGAARQRVKILCYLTLPRAQRAKKYYLTLRRAQCAKHFILSKTRMLRAHTIFKIDHDFWILGTTTTCSLH